MTGPLEFKHQDKGHPKNEPLRLNGGGDNTFDSQESVSSSPNDIANVSNALSMVDGISGLIF